MYLKTYQKAFLWGSWYRKMILKDQMFFSQLSAAPPVAASLHSLWPSGRAERCFPPRDHFFETRKATGTQSFVIKNPCGAQRQNIFVELLFILGGDPDGPHWTTPQTIQSPPSGTFLLQTQWPWQQPFSPLQPRRSGSALTSGGGDHHSSQSVFFTPCAVFHLP